MASAAMLLAGCSSTPLPPWPSASNTAPTKGAVLKAAKPSAPTPVYIPGIANPRVISSPVETAALQTAPLGQWQESAAVAARFPAPAQVYETPGLMPGRVSFTSNAELSQALHQLASAALADGTKAQVLSAGTSQQGTPIEALLLTRASATSLHALDDSGRPTVLLMAQQHGDEPAGSEALLVIAKELAQGPLSPVLDHINVLIVPRANPDGASTASRSTANGLDMNRDHLLLQTPEAQAIAKLSRNYRPVAVLDSHEFTVAGRYLEKFNAVQRYDALLQTPGTANVHEFISKASGEWYLLPAQQALAGQGHSTNWYYTTSRNADDRALSMGGVHPDTGRNVSGLKNAASLLIETRGIGIGRAHIQRRVQSHVLAITAALQTTAQKAKEMQQVQTFVGKETASLACRGEFVLDVLQSPERRRIVFLDPTTGEDRIQEMDWNSSVQLRTAATRARPCGYWLSSQSTQAADKLRALGLQVLKVAEPGSILADTYQEVARDSGPKADVRGPSTQAIERVKVQLERVAIDAPAGSFYVPLNQPLANLAIAALEPDTQSSYFANHIVTGLDDVARVMNNPSLVYDETE